MFESFLYKKEGAVTSDLSVGQISEALKDADKLLWVDIREPEDADIDMMTEVFRLHPLTVEDCILPLARPKVEKFSHYLFMMMYAIETDPNHKDKVKTVEVDFCLGSNFLITIHADPIAPLAANKDKVRKQSPMMMQGADFLLCSIIDSLVDSYIPVIDIFDKKVDLMSDELFNDPTQDTLNKIYNLKNEIMLFRRTLGPQADVINLIVRGDFDLIGAHNMVYYRNVYDNLVRMNDIIGNSRDIITSALEVYVSVVSNRLNEIMKTLTVIATIMMPLTLIASVYGMNFKYMPELSSRFGYPAVLLLMLIIAVGLLYYFKRKRWM